MNVKIAKSKKSDRWFVISTIFGVNILYAASNEQDCITFCEKENHEYSRGWEW